MLAAPPLPLNARRRAVQMLSVPRLTLPISPLTSSRLLLLLVRPRLTAC